MVKFCLLYKCLFFRRAILFAVLNKRRGHCYYTGDFNDHR